MGRIRTIQIKREQEYQRFGRLRNRSLIPYNCVGSKYRPVIIDLFINLLCKYHILN